MKKSIYILILLAVFIAITYSLFSKDKLKQAITAHSFQQLPKEIWEQPSTNLLWARCSLGQVWQNNNCIGEASKYTFTQAKRKVIELNQKKYLGYSDWRLPAIVELHGLIQCSTGFDYRMAIPNNNEVEQQREVGCVGSNYKRPTIDQNIFPNVQNNWYWSSTLYKTSSGITNSAWGVYLSTGFAYDLNQDSLGHVFLLRDKY